MVRSRIEKFLSEDKQTDSGSESSRSRSRSGSSGSGSGKSRSRSGSRSGSQSPARSRSGSRSRSRSPAQAEGGEESSPKKRQLSGSDQEDGSPKKNKDEDVAAEDLFGDDLSVSSEDEADLKAKKAVVDSDGDNVQRYDDDDDGNKRRPVIGSDSEEETSREDQTKAAEHPEYGQTEQETIPETRIDVEVPKINTDLGREIHFVKLPNFLSMESRPYDPDTYEDELDEDQNQQDEEGRTRLKLKVENTIRWRQGYDKSGNPIKESNARVVKWSDGSYSLHLGNEIFDVYKQPLQSDFNHLFIRQGTGLQGQAVFRTKLSFRPHSVDSHTHKKMTLSMADRSTKSNQIKVISHVGNNPEEGRYDKIKREEQSLRMTMRADATKKRVKEKGANKGLSGGYLEDGDDSGDENSYSIAAIKAKYKSGARDKKKPIYSSDEDDSDVETKKGKRLQKAKGVDSDSDSSRSRSKSSDSSKSRSSSDSRSRSRSASGSRSKSGSPASKKSSGSESD